MAEPMYRQIAEELRQRIESGDLAPGTKLPTELELREEFNNASRNTVRDAIRSLTSRGLVITRPGQGTYVVDRIVPFAITLSTDNDTGLGGGEGVAYMSAARAQLRRPDATVPRVEIQLAAGRVARELQVNESSAIVSRHQKLSIDGKPWSMQTSFYPMKFVEMGATKLVEATNIEPGVVRYVALKLGLEQAGYQDKILARPPDENEISFFKLPENGVAVIETVRTAYERSGTPIRCTVTVWPADRNRLVYNIGDVPPEIRSPAQAEDIPSSTEDEQS
ncbi:GntR family transcriptional regulator [Actinoplanes sp. NPDC048967]|uniref:GntR family transcriptional regulator n=1 Tax=Actinoplanes sp. NPDC048967 TaxID=3155269 RepID=UPI0033F07191